MSNDFDALKQLGARVVRYDQSLRQKVKVFTKAMEVAPWAMWVKLFKGDHCVMVYVNRAYGILYGVDPQAYIGQRDEVFWGKPAAEKFWGHDLLSVKQLGTPLFAKERIPDLTLPEPMPLEEAPLHNIMKLALRIEDQIYIYGSAVPEGAESAVWELLRKQANQ